jgi:GWxTD domain-containing protein
MDAILGVLGESSIRTIVIAIAVAGILRGMRVKSPVICHRAWTGLLLIMLFLPIISLWAPRIVIPLLPPAPSLQTQNSRDLVLGHESSQKTRVSTGEEAKPDPSDAIKPLQPTGIRKQSALRWGASETVFIFYSIGFLILLGRLLAGMAFSYRLACYATRDDKGFYISRISAPLTIGLLRPRILLPVESRDWDSGKLSVVLIHEEEHVRRRDPLVEWLSLLNRCIYWFHPLAWWLCGKLSALAEQSCDEAVIVSGHDCIRYAEHLLDFARSVKQRGALVTAWGSSLHGSTLAPRIRRIVSEGRSPAISRVRLVLVTVLCAGVSLVPAFCVLTDSQAAALPVSKISNGTTGITLPVKTAARDQQSHTRAQGTPPGTDALSSPMRRTAPDDVALAQTKSSHPSSPPSLDTVLYDTGLELLEKHRYEDARKAFQTLINTYPDSEFIASSYLAIGDAYYDEGGEENLQRAEDQYKNFVIFFPTHPKAADAQVKLCTIYLKMMKTPNNEEQYRFQMERAITRIIEQFPESEYVPALRQALAKIQESEAVHGIVPSQQSREHDLSEYYKRWLNEDVIYIITKEEKEAFLDLKSDEERQHFIDQFWARRNPDPGSKDNTFKEEHYRRLAYANRRFASGIPGWKTDRGRIYIMYGRPDEIESHLQRGEGEFPYELWFYRHIEGIGDKVTVEFVDKAGTGDYRITREPKKGVDIK